MADHEDVDPAADTASKEATRFGSSQPKVSEQSRDNIHPPADAAEDVQADDTVEKSFGVGEDASTRKTDPATVELNRARKEAGAEGTGSPGEHVADAGDIGG
jgi:hypothetical protein